MGGKVGTDRSAYKERISDEAGGVSYLVLVLAGVCMAIAAVAAIRFVRIHAAPGGGVCTDTLQV